MFDVDQFASFNNDGYLIVRGFLSSEQVDRVRARFDPLFRGEFETGLQPDEWNWRFGRSEASLTRQICNGWKADRTIARCVLSENVGRACATLMGWTGARINQDNVIWKPPGARSLGFHQDDAYQQWVVPPSVATCWIALDRTRKTSGTIEYARGSNRWPVEDRKFDFHAPQDYHEGLKYAAERLGIKTYQVIRIEAQPGDAVFHHGKTWHGSGPNNSDSPRRSVVAHCMTSESRFHPRNTGAIYSRYKRHEDTEMDESFFPIIYREDGYRSACLDHVCGR